jgi:hypothetical protein
MANMRAWHGLTFNANYAYSRAIDDAGTFRSGYAIPAGTIVNEPNTSFPADRMERTVSTSNQPQHLVVTTVWDWPLGKTILADKPRSGRFSEASSSPGSTRHTPARHCTLPDRLARPIPRTSDLRAPTLNPNFTDRRARMENGVRASTGPTTTQRRARALLPPVPSSSQYRQHHHRSYGAVYQPCAGLQPDKRRCSIRRPCLPTPLATRRVQRRTTSTVPATTSSTLPWCAASRCTSPNRPS